MSFGDQMATQTEQPTAQKSTVSRAQMLIQFINAQIESVVGAFTSPVIAVSNALSMQVDEVAFAYSGKCPDQSADVEPLDLDTSYVTILDALRRMRPAAYRMLADAAQDWHDNTPILYEQPERMSALSRLLVENLPDRRVTKGCKAAVSSAVTASLSTTPPPPQKQLTDSDTATASASASSDD